MWHNVQKRQTRLTCKGWKRRRKEGICSVRWRWDGLQQHFLFSDKLCGLKHAVILRRCYLFKAGWDLHLHFSSFHLFCFQLLLHHQWRPPSSQDAAAITAADARFFALISQVFYRIDLSLPQVVTLGKNSRGYHYILANLVSNNEAASQRGSRTCPILHAKGLSHYC